MTTEHHPRPDRRLGRHTEHDPRSLAYAHGVLPKSAIKSVAWTRRSPILNQGNIGACTGNALTGYLGTDSKNRTGATSVTVRADSRGVFTAGTYPLNEDFALKAYALNTWLDSIPGEYPAKDTGSSGIACGKSAQMLGLASGYSHAFSLDALKSALQAGPALIGIVWLNSMFDPKSDGRIVVDKASGVAGGHELVVSAYNAAVGEWQLDNSWGTSWGIGGSGYVADADMAWLLSQQGDVTIPTLTATPAPTPADVDKAFASAARTWLTAKGL